MEQLSTAVDWALSPKMFIIYLFVGSAVWIHYRGRARHRFGRQLTDHSTFMAPINVMMYAASAVPNRPYLNLGDFPSLRKLQKKWETIRDEAVVLYEQGSIKASDAYDDAGFNSFFRRGWTRFYLKWYGTPLPSALRDCPKTVALLESIPEVRAAMFTMLPPGSKLVRHRDPFAGSLRYHLGLDCPADDNCFLELDGERYSWRNGDAVVFDETFIHHAENNTDQYRLILFCDIERPMRYAWARTVNRFLSRTLLRLAATKNEAGERIGGLNKLFGVVYPIRVKAKALKKANRKLYYAIKYAYLAAIAAVVLILV